MTDLQGIADRVEIEALRGDFTDAVMTNDHDRLASLFTHDGAVRIPLGNIEATGWEEIRAMSQRRQALAEYFVQTTHPGTIRIDGDTATGRAYLSELIHGRDGSSHLTYFAYHDRYRRTSDGWKFTERIAEFRYLDTSPLAGAAPRAAEGTVAGMPDSGSGRVRSSYQPHHGEAPAGRRIVRKPGHQAAGSGYEGQAHRGLSTPRPGALPSRPDPQRPPETQSGGYRTSSATQCKLRRVTGGMVAPRRRSLSNRFAQVLSLLR